MLSLSKEAGMDELSHKKILIVDDNAAIHDDFNKILTLSKRAHALNSTNKLMFEEQIASNNNHQNEYFQLDSAFQGQDAYELVQRSIEENRPYAMAFVDIRMPPGWDGIATIKKIWEIDPHIQMVICSAYSDYSFEDIQQQLGGNDNLLILKKPFDVIEIRQLATTLTKKWELQKQVEFQIQHLEEVTTERTQALQHTNEYLDESLSILKSTLEATEEGILVLDDEEQLLMYNQKFLNLWKITIQEVDSKSTTELLQMMAERTDDPSAFLAMISNQCKTPKTGVSKELKLNNDQVLEVYLHPRYLRNRAQGVVFSFREITERKFIEDQLVHQATHDALTGLANRILLHDRLQQTIAYAKRNNLYVGVLMLDLDNFKQVNDSLGHNAGDDLLKIVAKKLQGNFREFDTITRFGGDEFVIILAQAHIEDLTDKANKLMQLLLEPIEINDKSITISASAGISIYPIDGVSPDDLLKNADSALYHAKDIGRNNFQYYLSEYNDNLLKKVELKNALKEALTNNELLLNYQPLLKLNSQEIIGVEALLRWTHPKRGLIMPNQFIPIAEETGLIIPIGEWVLHSACQQVVQWQKTINPELTVSVNISGKQIVQKNFMTLVASVLKNTGLSPEYLELEISERYILENSSAVSNALAELKEMGVKLSMDDFGIGYSSLNYVKYFPFDKIKIDKRFIDGINVNLDDKNIVEAIIDMAQSMGLQVLAEGVETKEQIDFLTSHHSNQIQGYYFSPPLDVKLCSEFLTTHRNEKQKE